MKILALETSSDACSAALNIDGEIQQLFEIAPRRHGELIIPMLNQLLVGADLKLRQLDAIAFGRGPGSFIGVRIVSGVVQGLAFGADLPVIPVSSMAAIAQQSPFDNILVAVDARMGEVYWANYSRKQQDSSVRLEGEEQVSKPEKVKLVHHRQRTGGAGTGWRAYSEILHAATGISDLSQQEFPMAAGVAHIALEQAHLGNMLDAVQAQPVYIRDKVAEKPN